MKTIRVILGILTVFIHLPIWWFIIYSILKAINPDRLIWFLFYTYIPLGLFLSVFQVIADKAFENK